MSPPLKTIIKSLEIISINISAYKLIIMCMYDNYFVKCSFANPIFCRHSSVPRYFPYDSHARTLKELFAMIEETVYILRIDETQLHMNSIQHSLNLRRSHETAPQSDIRIAFLGIISIGRGLSTDCLQLIAPALAISAASTVLKFSTNSFLTDSKGSPSLKRRT